MEIRQPRQQPLVKRLIRAGLGRVPFAVGISGPARDRLLGAMDLIFEKHSDPIMEQMVGGDGRHFELCLGSPNQRLMSYFYGNLLRHYRRTDFYGVLRDEWELSSSKSRTTPTFVDVGANLGFYCLLAADLGFDTVAVEADPTHSAFLGRHRELFGTVVATAAGDVAGKADFFVAGDNPGASSLVSGKSDLEHSSIYQERVEVPVQRLDQILDAEVADPSAIAIIKVDVEGHEEAVIRGLSGYLEEGHRPAIWCEVRGPQSGRAPSSYRHVIDVLATYGYEPYRYNNGAYRFDSDTEVPQVFDLLFRAPEGER